MDRARFGENSRYSKFLGTEDEILSLLVEHPDTDAVAGIALNVRGRAERLAETNFAAGTKIAEIAAATGGNVAESYLEGFLTDRTISKLLRSGQGDSIVSLVLDRNPQIVASPTFWIGKSNVSVLPKLMIPLARDPKLLRGTIAAMYEAEAWDPLTQLLDQLGRDALAAFLAHIDLDTSLLFDFPTQLHQVLGKRIFQIGPLIESLGPRALKFLSPELDARSWYIRYSKLTSWIAAEKQEVRFLDEEKNSDSDLFFLCLGLSSSDALACDLVTMNFSKVLAKDASQAISSAARAKLEPYISWHAPKRKSLQHRLIITVVRAFVDHSWPKEKFSDVFLTNEHFSRALSELSDFYQGRRFLDAYRLAVDNGKVALATGRKLMLLSLRY